MRKMVKSLYALVVSALLLCPLVHVIAMYKFLYKPRPVPAPELILISGCTGSGKSTFMMELALNKGMQKCISTDFVRQVMRNFSKDPALMRATYAGEDDPVLQWKECCDVLTPSIEDLADDSLKRGYSLVVEGVHLKPNNDLINKWKAAGGVALGLVLYIEDEDDHRDLIFKRAELMSAVGEKQLKSFDRIRAIQGEMLRMGRENDWVTVKQEIKPDPVDIVGDLLERRHRLRLQDAGYTPQSKSSLLDKEDD